MTIHRGQQLHLRSLVQASGMSQTALAGELNVTQPTVSRWLQRGAIREDNLYALRALSKERSSRLSLDRPRLAEAAAELALHVQDLEDSLRRQDAGLPARMVQVAALVLTLLTE